MLAAKYGRLTVLEIIPDTSPKEVDCVCDCGNQVTVRVSNLTRKIPSRSCGCLRSDSARITGTRTGPTNGKTNGAIKKSPGESGFNCLYKTYKSNAKARGLAFDLTKDEVKNITKQRCNYCGTSPFAVMKNPSKANPGIAAHSGYTYNGIDRQDPSIGYIPSNIVPCCKHCNVAKMARSVTEFEDWIKLAYAYITTRKSNV